MPAKKAVAAPEDSAAKLKTGFEKRIGISSLTLKPKFEAETPSERIKDLINLMSSRARDSRFVNLGDYKIWAAVDECYNSPLKSITPTLAQKIMTSGFKDLNELGQTMKEWGLDESVLIENVVEDGQKKKVLNRRTFWNVVMPLVRSVTTIRVAKLFTERDNNPFFAYQPSRMTEEMRLKCEIITNLVDRWVQQYGVKNRARQALMQSSRYNQVLSFITEAWHSQKITTPSGSKKSVREGLRLHFPHPTRMAWDLNYPVSSFNTDTGCEWACYWRVCRYGDIKDNPTYWNKDKVTYGTCWWDINISGAYFKEIYPCVIKPPETDYSRWSNDREIQASRYSAEEHDKAVFLTDFMIKCVPKEWDLGDYDEPLWFRFQMGNDDTVVYGEPLPDCPVRFLGWDTDESFKVNPSLALEVMPCQDLINNIMSQHVLSTRQNLAKIVPFDINQISEDTVKKLKVEAQEAVHVLYIPFDSRKWRSAGLDPTNMFKPITFGNVDTNALITCLNTVMNLMERMLAMSANESGAIAGHITTAQESRIIAQATSARAAFTGTYVDDFFDAIKRMFYRYMIEFMDDDFVAEIADAKQESLDLLKSLGFELGETVNGKTEVKGKKALIADIDSFVSTREGQSRINNPQLAQSMFQVLQTAVPLLADGRPETREMIIDMIDRAGQMSGVPRDFRIKLPLSPKKEEEGPKPSKESIDSVKYQYAPYDVQRQLEYAAGLQPSKLPPEQVMEAQMRQQENAAQAQAQQPQEMAKAAQLIQQGAVQQSVQEVSKGIQPVVEVVTQLKQQMQQLAALLAQNRQEDAKTVQFIGEMQKAVQSVTQRVMQHEQFMQAQAQNQQQMMQAVQSQAAP